MGLKFYGAVGVIALGAYGVSEADKSLNYTETTAKITKISTECTVEARKKKLVHKDTNKLAYMDCEMAKLIAPIKGYEVSDVKYHFSMEYKYKSPVDNKWHKDSGTKTSSSEGLYKKGQKFQILAHKEDPGKTRWK